MTVRLEEVCPPTPSLLENDTTHQDDAEEREDATRSTSYESDILLAAQLGAFASQHHRSEYSYQKYGPIGAPVAYVPLSLQLPDHFQQLLDQQAAYADTQAWWPSRKLSTPHDPERRTSRDNEPAIIKHTSVSSTLQEDLLNAISSPLTLQTELPPHVPEPIPPIKTSQTHPLNISMMIPPELLTIIATHSTRTTTLSPIMFDIPLPYQLHSLTSMPSYENIPIPNSETKFEAAADVCIPARRKAPRPGSTNFVSLLWSQKVVRKAFVSSTSIRPPHSAQSAPYAVSVSSAAAALTSARTHSVAPAARSGAPGLPLAATAAAYSFPGVASDEKVGRDMTNIIIPAADVSCGRHAGPRRSTSSARSASLDVPALPLGNLFLSSCPGKKVRLSGPVNGRGGVCRDLRQDLGRIRGLGVGCVVCCLDDDELQYLGAPWAEYARAADELGLDVLRIPTPEGLAPADAATLDTHLTRLVETYTLRGVPVLVHCRGGVGRAGLVACCWVLKLGLCGWIETQPGGAARAGSAAPEGLAEPPGEPAEGVRHDTLLLVERAIALVRRRRSPKAVETFEQVRFLAEYVEHLRAKAARVEGVTVGSVLDRDIRMK